jgi:hypothetical protein
MLILFFWSTIMENEKKNWKRELIYAETGGVGLRCHTMTPSANPQKKLVADYDTVAIVFKDKADVVRAATAMLALADSDEMNDEKTTIILKADRKPSVKKEGHSLSIVRQQKKK